MGSPKKSFQQIEAIDIESDEVLTLADKAEVEEILADILFECKSQDPTFIDRVVSRPIDVEARRMKFANWLADLLFDDFLEREELSHLKK